ncbi:hypothetical protein DNTS_030016 [Danionella cerebrum]|uniref:Uncharacterized protein n=1 Tax=Danionella cerebrum TaxID=2873325 RepID=A0A553NRS1_9TELE|nr:hypothetical protein DNTS_030016 [Danionella translucida]
MPFKIPRFLWGLKRQKVNGNSMESLLKNSEQTDGEQICDHVRCSSPSEDIQVVHQLKMTLGLKTEEQLFINIESFSQEERRKRRQLIEEFVESRFPSLPAEELAGSQLEMFLMCTKTMIFHEAAELKKVLTDQEMDLLINCYFSHLLTKLKHLLSRDLSMKEIFTLLDWGKEFFFR